MVVRRSSSVAPRRGASFRTRKLMKNNSSRYLPFIIVYLGMLWISMRFMHPAEQPKPPSPQQVTQLRQQAEQLLQEARTGGGGASLTLSERQQLSQQKYQEALRDFDRIAQLEPSSDLA